MINFKAVHWTDLIDLSVNGVCEPPLTQDFSDNELQNSLLTGEKINLPDFPSHSQGVERAVKLVTEASQSMYGFEARHQHILAKVLCQQLRPAFSSKGSYGTIWFHILTIIKQLFVFPYLFICCISIHIRKKFFFNIFEYYCLNNSILDSTQVKQGGVGVQFSIWSFVIIYLLYFHKIK